jgi:serine/threonine-protein kinase
MFETLRFPLPAIVVSFLPGLSAAQPDRSVLDRPTDPAGQITRFVNNYDGGKCFFVTVVKVTETTTETTVILDGYGNSLVPFASLDAAFHQIGVEAKIGFHQITPSQCSAANFLWRSRNQQGIVPHLDLVETKLRHGSMLTGTVANFGNRDVNLLMVADDGMVYNLTDRLTPAGDTKSFSVNMRQVNPGWPQPQLIFAVVASEPLEVLRPVLGRADQVFAQLVAETLQNGQMINVSAKYFPLLN